MIRSAALLLILVACDAGEKPATKPAPKVSEVAELPNPLPDPDPMPLPTRHRHAIPRASLLAPDTDDKLLPVHGAVAHTWGMAGDSMVILDQDKLMLRRVENVMGKPKLDRTRRLDSKVVEGIMKLAFQAWDEEQMGDMPQATDIREDLIVLDGDEAFYLTGSPLSSELLDQVGRPRASDAVQALYKTRD